MKKFRTHWRRGSNREFIAEQARQGKTKRETFSVLRDLVIAGTLVFTRNPTRDEKAVGLTHRIPLATTQEQVKALKDEIGRVYVEMGLAEGKRFEDDEKTQDEIIEEEEIKEEKKPIAKGKDRIMQELKYFQRRMVEIREFLRKRDEKAESVDWLGVRPEEAAGNLIPAGIPADALLYAMCLHWSKETRREAGVNDFDVAALSRTIMKDRGITEIRRRKSDGTTYLEKPHVLFGYILVLVENRQPVFLIGEMGTGKSHLCRQIADYLSLPYGETPMSLGATRGDLLGRFTANPEKAFIAARFHEIYANGGVFNFEEIDAADPGMLIVLNNALAGDTFHNSNSGESASKSENFIGMATGNTNAYGGNRRYPAREKLDEATTDRWRMGRVYVDFDVDIANGLLFRNV